MRRELELNCSTFDENGKSFVVNDPNQGRGAANKVNRRMRRHNSASVIGLFGKIVDDLVEHFETNCVTFLAAPFSTLIRQALIRSTANKISFRNSRKNMLLLFPPFSLRFCCRPFPKSQMDIPDDIASMLDGVSLKTSARNMIQLSYLM